MKLLAFTDTHGSLSALKRIEQKVKTQKSDNTDQENFSKVRAFGVIAQNTGDEYEKQRKDDYVEADDPELVSRNDKSVLHIEAANGDVNFGRASQSCLDCQKLSLKYRKWRTAIDSRQARLRKER